MLIQEKGNYGSKLKKGKLKTKNLLKITLLGEQEYKQQTKQCKPDVEEICIYQKRGKWTS